MNILTLEQQREDIINELPIEELEYNEDLSIEENINILNENLERKNQTFKISPTQIAINPEESKQLVRESLSDFNDALVYYGKQFWLWIKKWFKKFYTFIKTSYPFYKKVYNDIFLKLSLIKKEPTVPEDQIQAFKNKYSFLLYYLSATKATKVTNLLKILQAPFASSDAAFPVGDNDFKELAIIFGHYDTIKREFASFTVNPSVIGITLLPNNELEYNVSISSKEVTDEGILNKLVNKKIKCKFEFNSKYDLSLKDCSDKLKDYINDIDNISNIYFKISSLIEEVEAYHNTMEHMNNKINKTINLDHYNERLNTKENSKIISSVVTSYIKTFNSIEKLLQNFLKDYCKLYINNLEELNTEGEG